MRSKRGLGVRLTFRLLVGLVVAPLAATAQAPARSAVAGVVVAEDGRPLDGARVTLARSDGSPPREGITDTVGGFIIGALPAGTYTVGIRRIGYRSAELPALRLANEETRSLRVTLTQAPRRLSTVVVLTSPTAIDAGKPELPLRLDRDVTVLLPNGRDASSLIALVPGSYQSSLWGGAGAVANDYRLDGVSVSHPGAGGDFLRLSVDWIEALEVRGLGAGAEYGNFQGGSINAITRSGSNTWRASLRTNLESPRLTSTNLNRDEEGSEPAGRREISAEMVGPLARDRLFYFVAGQLVDRAVRAPALTTAALYDFQNVQEAHRDARGLIKLTWIPVIGDRVDVLAGFVSSRGDHVGLNGVDDPAATTRVSAPATFYEAAWTRSAGARATLDVRLAGFTARESRRGYAGESVPAVQPLQLGRQPTYQNAAFDELLAPSSIGGNVTWRGWGRVLRADHQLLVGGETARGSWRQARTRNGGVTWRPYAFGLTAGLNPADASTWETIGSDWGGDVHVDSDVSSDAVFVQDYLTIAERLTLSPGLRFGRWTGWLKPACSATGAAEGACVRFSAVHANALEPRIGVAWDLTGRNDLVLKAHWGRYHQEMFSNFFDRAAGSDAYSNHLFYYNAPRLTDSRTTFTAAERESLTNPNGFSTFYTEEVLDESGRVERYQQPYVDQTVLGVEKAIGQSWKLTLLYTHRRNGDIVGLVDRNRARNFSVLRDVHVENWLGLGRILDARGRPLVLPEVYVPNNDLVAALSGPGVPGLPPPHVPGYSSADIPRLGYSPDVVLTTIPEARRRYDQLTLSLLASQTNWSAAGSLTAARLRGNVAGVTGGVTTGSTFNAGPFVRPNETINFDGDLPGSTEFEGKLWLTARLSRVLQGGVLLTHVVGERFTPTFQLAGLYRYVDGDGNALPDELFRHVAGQTVFLEPRGSWHYANRTNLDAHLEWRALRRSPFVVMADVFNVLGSRAVVAVQTSVDEQSLGGGPSYVGATRLRVPPRTLRLGLQWN